MTKKSEDSLFDITSKTLSESQISNVITRFKKVCERFTKLPQVELVDKSKDYKHLILRFISLSDAGNFNIPSIHITELELCKNMETVKSINLDAYNCGTCRGGSHANFNNKNIQKLDQVLVNIETLFEKNYQEAMKRDAEEVEFNKVIEKAKNLVNYNIKDVTRKSNYNDEMITVSKTYIGNILGDLYENRDKRDFRIEFEHISIQQLEILSKVISNL